MKFDRVYSCDAHLVLLLMGYANVGQTVQVGRNEDGGHSVTCGISGCLQYPRWTLERMEN